MVEITLIAFGFLAGWIVREQVAIQNIKSILDSAQTIEEDEDNEERVLVKIETHSGMLFAYMQDDNSFVTQAKSSDELKEKLSEIFPNKTIACDEPSLIILKQH